MASVGRESTQVQEEFLNDPHKDIVAGGEEEQTEEEYGEQDAAEEEGERVMDEEMYHDQVKEIEAEMLQFVKSQSQGDMVLSEHQEPEVAAPLPPLDPELTMDEYVFYLGLYSLFSRNSLVFCEFKF